MTVLFNDLKLMTSDLLSNYNVTTVDKGNKERAINRAIEYVQRKLGLPSDKKIWSFYFYDDTKFYTTPDGFNELLQLYYNTSSVVDSDYNNPRNRWFVDKDIELLRATGNTYGSMNKVAFTTINQLSQLMLVGSNIRGSSIINAFDNTTGLTFSSSITGTSIDTYVKKQGSGSLKFSMDNSASTSTITMAGSWDITQAIAISSAYRLYIDFPVGAAAQFTNVKLSLISSVGNSYDITATTQDDGTAWTENVWDRLSFSLANATTTGTPVASQITSMVITFTHSGTFTAVSNIRMDYLYQVNPDYMDVVYYSSQKGTNQAGTVPKVILDEDSDIVSFGAYAPDLVYPIALKAASILQPQLRFNPEFYAMYKADFIDVLTLMSRTYPRQRQAGNAQTQLIR
jgi:hypothetical protein